jgi:ATP-dependent RNA helicase RhlE
MSGKNVVGIAQTGTGKTLAYLLPLIQQHKYSEARDPRILILVPTRELVTQVVSEIESLTQYINLRVVGVYGGTNINTQKQIINEGCDFLVATPGRLLDLNLTGVLKLKKVKKLVIDEVDEMLNLGFLPQLTSILERLNPKRQNLMFSATMLPKIEIIIHDFFHQHEKIEIAASGTPLEKIQQFAYQTPNFFTKANLLKWLLEQEEQDFSKVLIFIESKKLADKLYEQFGFKVIPMPTDFKLSHREKDVLSGPWQHQPLPFLQLHC